MTTTPIEIAFARPCARYGQAGRRCSLHGRCHEADAVEAGDARELSGCRDFFALTQSWDRSPALERWARRSDVRARHVTELAALADASAIPQAPATLAGDGVVVCGGGSYWPMIALSVRMLREVSALPVQVWYRGAAEVVEPAELADVAGVTFRDTTSVTPTPRMLGGWEAKTLAIRNSGFRRVLYLDADAYAVADPAPLLDLASAHRFVFWADCGGDSIRWENYGLAPALPVIQGGQLAIDCAAFWRELCIADWINQHSDYFYAHQYGDQDSWRVALAATGAADRGDCLCLGPAPWIWPAFVCGLAGGVPLIVHRCQGKIWSAADQVKAAGYLPKETRVWHYITHREGAAGVFGRIYASGLWGYGDASGGGSTPAEAAPYVLAVNALLRKEGARSVVDVGCGDGRVAGQIEAERLAGVDVHAPHIERLRKEQPGRAWLRLDVDRDREAIPAADVWLVKDVLQHWPDALVRDWLAWALRVRRCRLLVLTNDREQLQGDPPLGGYRGLDPARPPLADFGGLVLAEYLHKAIVGVRLG